MRLRARSISACTRRRSSRSSTSGPYSTSRLPIALAAVDRPAGAARASHRQMRPRLRGRDAAVERRSRGGAAVTLRRRCSPARRARRRLAARDRHEAHGVAGRQLTDLPQLGLDRPTNGQTKPPSDGPVGPEDDRHVAREIDRADSVGVVVDVRRDAARPRRRRGAPTAASGRSGGRRCGWSCSAPARRCRRASSMSSGGEEVGRAVRAVEHAERPSRA